MEKNGVFDTLVSKLTDLPGIGKKTAQRLAFYIMKLENEEALSLARAIEDVKKKVTHCSSCFNLTEVDPCNICSDPKRDRSVICVIENPSDVNAIEKAGIYRGIYHVLSGALSPLDNIGPDLFILPRLSLFIHIPGLDEVHQVNAGMARNTYYCSRIRIGNGLHNHAVAVVVNGRVHDRFDPVDGPFRFSQGSV